MVTFNSNAPARDPALSAVAQNSDQQSLCRLLWRQGRLWVMPATSATGQVPLPALAHPSWFQSCINRSKARAVVIDPRLGSEVINTWAQACHQAGKPLYLRLPTLRSLSAQQNLWAWRAKCALERLIGLVLLVLLSPLMALFAVLIKQQDGGSPWEYYWCIGQRGHIFRMAQFRRESLATGHKTTIGHFLELTRLDRLPRLTNLVRGEMTLIGTKPWSIDQALEVPVEFQPCLRAMPGIVGPRPLGLNVPVVDVRAICLREVSYLKDWTLWRDSQMGLSAVVQMLTGSMAP